MHVFRLPLWPISTYFHSELSKRVLTRHLHDVPDTSTGPWMGFFGFNVMLRPPLDTLPCPSPSGHVPGISEWGGPYAPPRVNRFSQSPGLIGLRFIGNNSQIFEFLTRKWQILTQNMRYFKLILSPVNSVV